MKNTRKQAITTKTLIPLLLISLALLISLSTVSANEIYVNTTGNDTSGTGTADNPYLTLQTGINNLDADGTLRLANGQYNGTGNTNITLTQNLTIIGESQDGTIINGTDTNWIFNIQPGISVTLYNLTLTNGYTQGSGGAIYNQGNLTVTYCNFTNNQASYGGAIYNDCFVINDLGSVTCTVSESSFINNQATNGGAIVNYCYVVLTGSGSLNSTISKSSFINNQATNGGAIYNLCSVNGLSGSATCTSTINESTFTYNQATNGGAIYNDCILPCEGGIATASSTSIINECTFTNNQATNGGAIRNYCIVFSGSGSLNCTINESTFTNNQGTNGGAILNYGYVKSGSGSLNCSAHFNRFYNNSATTSGNAIHNINGYVDATLNWWGSNEDPSSQFYGGNIVYDPWIVLTISADPATIYNTRTSTITANLLYDSRSLTDPNNPAYYHAPELGCVPDTPVTFDADSLGDLTPNKPYTTIIPSGQNGTVIFTALNTGVSEVNATVDNETVKTSITIIPQIEDAYVATAADGGNDSNDGSSSNPFLTLEKAINAVIGGGRIHIANGVYKDTKNRGLTIDHDMTIFRDTWISGTGNSVIIDADDKNNFFHITCEVNCTVENLTFVNGTGLYISSIYVGGAIYNEGNLTIKTCNFTNNTAVFLASAILNTGTCNIIGSTFTNNNMLASIIGGAICNIGTLNTTDCIFTANNGYAGGAILQMAGSMNITNCIFSNNNATAGGAIYSAGNAYISGSTFNSNNATMGGAIYGANLEISDSSFTGNTATEYGGAITAFGNVNISPVCTFSGNSAQIGGAIMNIGTLNLTGSSFTGNNATAGGAILNIIGTMNITDCTITGNNATNGDIGSIFDILGIDAQGDGGAIFNILGTININGGTLTGNNATNRGGAICNIMPELEELGDYRTSLTISGTQLTNNIALYGGSIYNNGTTNITGSTFTGNNATSEGGAICNALNGTVNINSTLFSDNLGVWGGAIQNYGTLTVYAGSIFTENLADFGGAISNREGSNSIITSCNFIENSASFVGGAISNIVLTLGGYLNITVLYCNIINNTATVNGGAIFKDGNGDIQAHYNRILNNTNIDAYNVNLLSNGNCLNATNNWWGSNFDGSNPTDTGRTNSNVISDTWVILSVNADPSTINNGGTSNITADLNHYTNTLGETGQLTDHIPEVTITLDIPWGSFSNTTINHTFTMTTINGNITAVFYANEGAFTLSNPLQLNATADGYTTSTYITILKSAQLNITKTGPATVIAGNPITYTITVTNQGPDDASNVIISDILPLEISNVTWTATYTGGASGPASGTGNLNIDVDTLPSGGTCVITVNGTVLSSTLAETILSNTANLTTTSVVIDETSNTTDTLQTTVKTLSDIQIAKTVNNARPDVGDTVTFTVTVHNNGPSDALDIQVLDVMPSGFDNLEISPSEGYYDGSTGIWTLNITNGQTATLNLTGKVTSTIAGNNITNTATLVGSADTANSTIYVPKADLYIQISSDNNTPTVGETFTLTYKLGNNGPDDATNVTITIPLPEGFHISSVTGDGSWTINGNTITWTFNNVTVGDPYLYISGWTTGPGLYIFSASIASKTFSVNSRGVNSLSLNAEPQLNAATSIKSIGMQKTGTPIAGIVLAILMVFGGFISTRRKQ